MFMCECFFALKFSSEVKLMNTSHSRNLLNSGQTFPLYENKTTTDIICDLLDKSF